MHWLGILFFLAFLVAMMHLVLLASSQMVDMFGAWILLLILLYVFAAWLDRVWGDSRPGEFWRNVGARLSAPRWRRGGSSRTGGSVHQAASPSFYSQVFRPRLPAHLLDLDEALTPLLVRLHQLLRLSTRQPGSLPERVHLGRVASRLSEAAGALSNLHRALVGLQGAVEAGTFGRAGVRNPVMARVEQAVADLIRVYETVAIDQGQGPEALRLARLALNLRANLERLTMWLANILAVLREPERILWEGEADDATTMAMNFNLRFSWPENLQELDTWADTPTGYDPAAVAAILDLPLGHDWVDMPAPARQGLGFWGWVGAIALGSWIGSSLGDDD